MNTHPRHVRRAIQRIELYVAAAQDAIAARGRAVDVDAAQVRTDARDQLARAEWFDHVVVGTNVQARDAVDLLATSGEQQDGRRQATLLTQPPTDVNAIAARQHHIQ